jgi:ERCC4-type nuclease
MDFNPTKLVLDSREKMPGLEKNFKSIGYDVVREALPCGDILVPEAGILIERKTTNDLLGSIASKRLQIQLNSMLEQTVAHKALLIEGIMNRDWVNGKTKLFAGKFWMPSNFHPASIANLLWSYQKNGMIVIQSSNVFDSSSLVHSLIQNELKDDSERRPFDLFTKPKAETKEELQLRLLSSLPHISSVNSRAILAFYQGDVMKALNDYQNWGEKIDGVGKKIVEDLQQILKN